MSRQRALAAALLIVWILVGMWQWSMLDAPTRVPLIHVSHNDPSPAGSEFAPEWTLEKHPSTTRESPSVPKRNLFAAFTEPRKRSVPSPGARMERVEKPLGPESSVATAAGTTMPVVVQGVEPAVHRLSPQAMAEQAGRIARERRQKQLTEYYAQYRLLGVADRDGVKHAFIGKGTDIYIVRQGDMLGDMFLVSLVEESGVKISDVEYHLEYTLQLKTEGAGAF